MASDDRTQPPRSFVFRSGRITAAQRRALDTLWCHYGAPPGALATIQTLFANPQAPLTLEIGFGNGENLVRLAAAKPDENFIGIEVYPPGIGHTLRHCKQQNLNNVRIVRGDAVDAVALIAAECLTTIIVLFPDPWPKRRHHKRRLLKKDFMLQLAQKLRPGGRLYIASDCEDYAREIIAQAGTIRTLCNEASDGLFCSAPVWYHASKFERHAGRRIFHIRYRRKTHQHTLS